MEITGFCRFREDKDGLLYPDEDRFASESDNKADVLLEDTWVHGAWKVQIGFKKPLIVGINPVERVYPRLVWRKVRCHATKREGTEVYEQEFMHLKRRYVLAFEVFIEIE